MQLIVDTMNMVGVKKPKESRNDAFKA